MNVTRTWPRVALILSLVAALGAGLLAVAALATSEPPDEPAATLEAPAPRGGHGHLDRSARRPEARAERHERMRERRADLIAELAAELGVEAEDLERALRTVRERRLAEAVEEGRISEDQAAQMLECYDGGECPNLRAWRRFGAWPRDGG